MVSLLMGTLTTAMKAKAARMPLLSGPGRKFGLSLAPPMVAGAVLYAAGLALMAGANGFLSVMIGGGILIGVESRDDEEVDRLEDQRPGDRGI